MKLLKYLSTGLAIGFVCTTFFMVAFMGLNDVTKQVLAWCIASALFGLSALIFECRALNLLSATAIHYLLCLVVVAVNVSLFYGDYMAVVLINYTVTYFVIYVIMWLVNRNDVKTINAKLNQ